MMRFYTTRHGKLIVAAAIVVFSLGVAGCFQTADATASPGTSDQGQPQPDNALAATPSPTLFIEPTPEFAPSPIAVAQDPTIDPFAPPTTDPFAPPPEQFVGEVEMTQTSVQSTLFAQATAILEGVTQTAAVDQTLTATALGTGMPFQIDPNTGQPIDPNTGLPFPIDPNTGQPIDPNTGQPIIPLQIGPTPTPVGAAVDTGGASGTLDQATCVYTVVAGDRIFRIALRFGLATEAVARANGIVNPELISIDQKLRIPAPGCVLPSTPTATPSMTLTPSETPGEGTPTAVPVLPTSTSPLSGTSYTVQAGDTLFGISLRTGVRISALAQANNIQNINLIYIGQTLIIP